MAADCLLCTVNFSKAHEERMSRLARLKTRLVALMKDDASYLSKYHMLTHWSPEMLFAFLQRLYYIYIECKRGLSSFSQPSFS